jgi:hypothetical protein
MTLLSTLDAALAGGIVLVTVWFFFLQSPFLFKRLGRAKFVPIMMQMTRLFFDVQVGFNFLLVLLSAANTGITSSQTLAAMAAAVAVLFNWGVVVPRALAAGKASAKDRNENPDSHSATDFAIEGGSKTKTKGLHQTVVAVVFANVGAIALHLFFSL